MSQVKTNILNVIFHESQKYTEKSFHPISLMISFAYLSSTYVSVAGGTV